MGKRVFVSYRHSDGDWVWSRLQPVLQAAGAEVLIDAERFEAGKGVVAQMDSLQDAADSHLLVLSEDYLDSEYCRHEMDRAIAVDPEFTSGKVIPVWIGESSLGDSKLPRKLMKKAVQPLFVCFPKQADQDALAWDSILRACDASLGTNAIDWLRARDELVRHLGRNSNVNLVIDRGVHWMELIEHLRTAKLPKVLLPELRVVDLEDPVTHRRHGLLTAILRALGSREHIDPDNDLFEFGERLDAFPQSQVALIHADMVTTAERRDAYGIDLFAALRHRSMTKKQLVLLVHSHAPFASLLPIGHPLSEIDFKQVELRNSP